MTAAATAATAATAEAAAALAFQLQLYSTEDPSLDFHVNNLEHASKNIS